MQYASLLKEGSFDEARMPQNVEACDWLATALRGLDPPLLDPAYAGMRAVSIAHLSATSTSRCCHAWWYMVETNVEPHAIMAALPP